MANKFLGQHFLKNPAVVKKIIGALEVRKGDTIIEIGPGNGELTLPLKLACEASGCTILAIEKDAALTEALVAKGVNVVLGDALRILGEQVGKIAGPYEIVGNIPYYITGHLLRIIDELEHRPERAVLMVQKEVAERIVAVPPRMNRLAASVQFWGDPKILCAVKKEEFAPTPKVGSAVVVSERKKEVATESGAYYSAMRALFAQPRKTLLNNLTAALKEMDGKKEKIAAALKEIAIDPEARPQNLTIEEISLIAKALF